MSTYLSSLLTSTTSKYTSLKRSLLSDESDGPTEDDTHISRVLRAYYTEKGRVFPPWLPPDPNQAPMQSAYARPGMLGRRTDGTPAPAQSAGPAGGAGGGLLSDLWGGSDRREEAPPAPVSLRRGAGPPRPSARPGGDSYSTSGQGSYQQSYSGRQTDSSTPPPGTTSAQERLRARLWGARGGAQSPGPGSQGRPGLERVASDNSIGSSSSGRGGGGAHGSSQRPYVSASAPWESGDQTGGGSGYGEPARRTGGRAPAGGGRYG